MENGRPVELMVVMKDALVSPSAVRECKPTAGGSGRRGLRDADDVLLGTGELLAAAERFIMLFHDEEPRAAAFADRMRQVRGEVEAYGTYRHTPEELTFAARVAWRNSARCIGRLYWRTLRVRDRRQVSAADQIAAECVSHLREATNGGQIRPMITVFAPDTPDGQARASSIRS